MGLLGRLNIKLSADTADFYNAMDKSASKAQMAMRRIQSDVKRVGAVVGAVLLSSAGAFSAKMKSIIDDADELSKMSQKLGVSVESLSVWRHAANLADADFETLTKGLAKFSRTVSDASMGMATAKRPLEQLGIEYKNMDGSLKTVDGLLLDVADKFSQMSDGTKKAALAQELFGRSGVELIPFLNEGRAGLEDIRKEAEKLGIVFNTETSKAAEEFNDNLTRLKGVFDGVFVSVGNSLIPVLVDLQEEFLASASNTEDFKNKGDALATTLLTIVDAGARVGWVFKAIGTGVGDIGALLSKVTDPKAAMAILKKGWADQKEMLEDLDESSQERFARLAERLSESAAAQNSFGAAVAEGTEAQEDHNTALDRSIAKYTQMAEKQKRSRDLMRDLGATFTSSAETAIMAGEKIGAVLQGLLEDIERIALRKMILEPFFNSIFGDTGLFSGGSQPAAVENAHGNAFAGGHLMRFAGGGVIGGPMMFPLSGGRRGLAGEAGEEGILPLTRTSGGDLGVKAEMGGGTVVNVYAPPGSNVSEERKMDGNRETIEIYIDNATASNLNKPGSRTYQAMRKNFGVGQTLINR